MARKIDHSPRRSEGSRSCLRRRVDLATAFREGFIAVYTGLGVAAAAWRRVDRYLGGYICGYMYARFVCTECKYPQRASCMLAEKVYGL